MRFNTQNQTYGLQSISENSRLVVQEDSYDTPRVQEHIRRRWKLEGAALLSRDGWTPGVQEKFALHHLRRVVDYAFEFIPFYNECYKSHGYTLGALRSLADFKRLPILNKNILTGVSPEDFIPRNLVGRSRKMWWTSTSGSSGCSLRVLNDLNSITNNALDYYRMFKRLAGGDFTPDRWIYNVHHIRSWPSSLCGDFPTFTLNDIRDPEEFIRHLEYLNPVVINILPSYLPLLVPYAHRLTALKIKAIVTNSEASSRQERQYYSDLFSIPILDEYSSEEVGIIALECPFRRYHLSPDQVYVELDDHLFDGADGTFFNVYCTDYLSRGMPFIRYDHGDIVSVVGGDEFVCGCGRRGRAIERVEGRKDDSLKSVHRKFIPSAIITNTLDSYFNANPYVQSFRLIQRRDLFSLDFFYVGASVDKIKGSLSLLEAELRNILKMEIALTAIQVSLLPDNPGYKRKKVVFET